MYISCNLMHLLCPPQSNRDTGLGNTLFQLATMYALSKDHNLQIHINELESYCNLLKNFNYDHKEKIFKKWFELFDNHKINNIITIRESEDYPVEQFLDTHFLNKIKSTITNNILIEGYFQSHLYFDKYKFDLYNLFEIDTDSFNYIQNKYPILFDTNITTICIHIRMNYANCINYNFNYFETAINYFKEKFHNIHFLIFSNNINSIENWFDNINTEYTYITKNIDYIDLWIMSLCKHNIITHSTFSWWGAYLNKNPNKVVTFPMDTLKISYGYLYPHYKYEQRRNEYYLPEWIGIDSDTLYLY